MTWLKGSTTWEALTQDIARLVCGEIADGSSNFNASGDRWVREFTRTVTDGVLNGTTTLTSATAAFTSADVGARVFGTGIPTNTVISSVTNGTTILMSKAATTTASGVTVQICFDTIRTKSGLDVSIGNCSNRTGYFAQWTGPDTSMAVGRDCSCKITTGFTSDPSTSGFHRWVVRVGVTVANSVAGNYSTATVSEVVHDADSGATIASNNRAPNAAGLVTGTNGLTYTVADASGILSNSVQWVRAFTATYMRGIDYWPMLYRQGATAPTFSVAPPGVASTDYDIVYGPASASDVWFTGARGNLFHGLGIKTATGLGANALYTTSFSLALMKMRIFNGPGGNGQLSLDVGQSKLDNVNGNVIRNAGGLRVTTWCRCATTPGSVTNSTSIQYWLSVKSDGIYLVLNADPGATGKMGNAWVGAFTPTEATYDVLPVSFSISATDRTAAGDTEQNLATQYAYFALRRRQDGSHGSRDWQTNWMRSDIGAVGATPQSGMDAADVTSVQNSAVTTNNTWGHYSLGYVTSATVNQGVPPRQVKPGHDGKWWLYAVQYGEGTWDSAFNGVNSDENRLVRGTQSTRYFYLPGDQWASGDELTDTSTTQKYFLHVPDYVAVGMRINQSYQSGMAVAEL